MNRSKAKGTEAETAVVNYLTAAGWPEVERRTQAGAHDKGDVRGIPDVVIEVKNEKTMTLASYVNEATVEAINAGVPVGVVWHKRRGKSSPADWYVSMSGAAFVELLRLVAA